MTGLMLWNDGESSRRQHRIAVEERSILHVRFWQAEILRGAHTPAAVLRRRVAAAEKKLRKAGVTRLILPEGLEGHVPQKGLQTVSTAALRRMLAADWVQHSLTQKRIRTAGAKVAVAADRLSGEVVRTVTELALRHRYVLLDLPAGGEELCRRLRREYGVSLLLNPDRAQMEEAEVLVLFAPRRELARQNPVVVPLYDEQAAMPPLFLPPALEEKLPCGTNRVQLLAVLVNAGAVRAGADLTF